MKYTFLAVVCSFLLAGSSFASPQDLSSETKAAVPQGEALSLDQVLDAQDAESDSSNFYSYWHCTAYAQGHGHDWGFDYTDRHYNHAYWGARRTCEYNTHHSCPDVHCHVDHH